MNGVRGDIDIGIVQVDKTTPALGIVVQRDADSVGRRPTRSVNGNEYGGPDGPSSRW